MTITINGKPVEPNPTGISISSTDVIAVNISGSKEIDACFKNVFLQVLLTENEKVNTGKNNKQPKQSQVQQSAGRKPNNKPQNDCSVEGYKFLSFKSVKPSNMICSFKAKKYWKQPEAKTYLFLCQKGTCGTELTNIIKELSKYSFYLTK